MRRPPNRLIRLFAVLSVLALVLAACGGDDATDEPAETTAAGGDSEGDGDGEAPSLAGETVRLIVPYDPGGGFDTYARAVAPYIAGQLEAEVVVENRPGAGGLLGANEVFQADPDGLTIGIINYPGAVFGTLTGQEGATFDNSQWTVLGRIAAVSPMIYSSVDGALASADDLIGAEEDVVFSLGGVGSDAYYGTIIIGETLGFPYQLVTGYDGTGEQNAALLAGEADATFSSIDSAQAFIDSGDGVPLLYVSDEQAEAFPDTQTVIEAAGDDDDAVRVMESLAAVYSLERIIVAPPDVDPALAEVLGDALFAAMTDPEFEADMEEAERSLNVLGLEDARALIESASAGLEDLQPLLEEE